MATNQTSEATKLSSEEKSRWTKPYHGVQHLGRSGDLRWATVTNYGSSADVTCWGVGISLFQAPVYTLLNAEQAREAGERWVSHGIQPQQVAA